MCACWHRDVRSLLTHDFHVRFSDDQLVGIMICADELAIVEINNGEWAA